MCEYFCGPDLPEGRQEVPEELKCPEKDDTVDGGDSPSTPPTGDKDTASDDKQLEDQNTSQSPPYPYSESF